MLGLRPGRANLSDGPFQLLPPSVPDHALRCMNRSNQQQQQLNSVLSMPSVHLVRDLDDLCVPGRDAAQQLQLQRQLQLRHHLALEPRERHFLVLPRVELDQLRRADRVPQLDPLVHDQGAQRRRIQRGQLPYRHRRAHRCANAGADQRRRPGVAAVRSPGGDPGSGRRLPGLGGGCKHLISNLCTCYLRVALASD